MLSPTVHEAKTLLAQAFDEITQLDGFAAWAGSIQIGKLPEDPDWLASVRNRIAMLGRAGAAWTAAKPGIWGSVLVRFTDYATAFSGVEQAQQKGPLDKDKWVAVLGEVLLPAGAAAATATRDATAALERCRQAFSDITPLLEDSIEQGWTALAGEEEQMVEIAAALTSLLDQLGALQDSITAADVGTGQSVVTTTVKILYNVATEVGESFSFLGMAASAFTVGKFFYDLITETDEVADTLRQIAERQVAASEAAQAAAGTKLVLRLLYDLELSFGRIGDVLPQITKLWEDEGQKVQDAIDALAAGADPVELFDLATVGAANANWQAIDTFALAIPTLKNVQGPAVTLDPQHPLTTRQ